MPVKAPTARKAVVAGGSRAQVVVALGENLEHASFWAFSIPDAHELVHMLQHALAAPLPRVAS